MALEKKYGPHSATAMLGDALNAMVDPNVNALDGSETLPTVATATVGVVPGVGVGVGVLATATADKGVYVQVDPELMEA